MKNIKNARYFDVVLKIIQITAFLFIASAILFNPHFVGQMLDKTESFSQTTLNFIYIFETALFLFGIVVLIIEKYILRKTSDKVKEVITNLMLFFCSLIICLLLFEVSVRIFEPQKTLSQLKSESPAIYDVGENISWQLKPNSIGLHNTGEFNVTYHINSLGMRDKERSFAKQKGVTRILVLGDSFTFGFGVNDNETYPYVLEQLLNNGTKKFEVWNAGVSGYSPDTYYVYLKNTIEKIKPDIVLVGFYAGNDVLDACHNQIKTDKLGLPIEVKSKIMYVENNQLRLTDNKSNPYTAGILTYVNIALSRFSQSYLLIKKIITGVGANNFEGVQLLTTKEFERLNKLWDETKRLLEFIQDLSKQHNASFQIAIIPLRLQINENEWNYVKNKFKNYEPSRNQTQEKLTRGCTSNKINCIDVMPELLESEKELYYTVTDAHFNKEGHKTTAKIISRKIII